MQPWIVVFHVCMYGNPTNKHGCHSGRKLRCSLIIVRQTSKLFVTYLDDKHTLTTKLHQTDDRNNFIPYICCAWSCPHVAVVQTGGWPVATAWQHPSHGGTMSPMAWVHNENMWKPNENQSVRNVTLTEPSLVFTSSCGQVYLLPPESFRKFHTLRWFHQPTPWSTQRIYRYGSKGVTQKNMPCPGEVLFAWSISNSHTTCWLLSIPNMKSRVSILMLPEPLSFIWFRPATMCPTLCASHEQKVLGLQNQADIHICTCTSLYTCDAYVGIVIMRPTDRFAWDQGITQV